MALAQSRAMAGTADGYLSILGEVSSAIQQLMTEMSGGVFNPETKTQLPQGLKNDIQDPRELITQLMKSLCLTPVTATVCFIRLP